MGATVAWDEASRSVKVTKGAQTLTVNVENNSVTLNGKESSLAANLDNGTLYLSLDAFNQLTGMSMKWDALSERLILK
ncbi:hypothetical protein D3C71_2029680 [compost metagenome]